MAKLSDLTVPLLEELAEECGIHLKKSDKKSMKVATIEAHKIPQDELNHLIEKYLNLTKGAQKHPDTMLSELKGRIKLLEEQVRFLMSKMSVSEVQVKDLTDADTITITSNLTDLKRFIKSMIMPNKSMSIDDLIEIKELQKIPLITLKHAIYDLIDEGILLPSEGKSRQKIGGKIGILTRK